MAQLDTHGCWINMDWPHGPGAYEDARGLKRFKGLPALRDSQPGSQADTKKLLLSSQEFVGM